MSASISPPPAASRAVIASPDAAFRSSVRETLQGIRWQLDEAQGGAEALFKIDSHTCQALLLDSWLPDLNVNELVRTVRARHPHIEIVLLNEELGADREGPFSSPQNRELFWAIRNVQRKAQVPPATASTQDSSLSTVLAGDRAKPLPGMIGESEAMGRVYVHARLVAKRDATVLITGETGTGKELVAKAIHQLSPRANRAFVVLNCAAIPDTLLESELFGHTRGAFTGAVQSRMGRLQAADGGTLFLDEVGELSANMQAKLLRFLQDGEIQRLGETEGARVDVRVVAATNSNLHAKNFRDDLYYRLSVFPLELPPLRSRMEDLNALTRHFLNEVQAREKISLTISPSAMEKLQAHSWPGNVRELRHVIERAAILASEREEISAEHIVLTRRSS